MDFTISLIDIFYNPAGYCDRSWLASSGGAGMQAITLPAVWQNHLLLAQLHNPSVATVDIKEDRSTLFFIRNWHKVGAAAYLIGLKLFSAQILNNPRFIRKLKNNEREFLCLPLSFASDTFAHDKVIEDEMNITRAGANYILSLAKVTLPAIFTEYLRLIFPVSFDYTEVPHGNIEKSLSTLKWAFDYA